MKIFFIQILQRELDYRFYDDFTDPFSIREKLLENSQSESESELFNNLTEFGGTAYDINGEWATRISGILELKDPE